MFRYIDDLIVHTFAKDDTSLLQESLDIVGDSSESTDMPVDHRTTKGTVKLFCKDPDHHTNMSNIAII